MGLFVEVGSQQKSTLLYTVNRHTQTYIGETTCRLETRLKEHKDACIKGFTNKSAIAEHAWMEDNPICWDDHTICRDDTRILRMIAELWS